MPNDNSTLPKINLDSEESVLIPKIEVDNTGGSVVGPSAGAPEGAGGLSPKTPPVSAKNSRRKIWMGVGIAALVFLAYNLIAGFVVYRQGMKLADAGKKLQAAAQSKDLAKIKTELDATKKSLKGFSGSFSLFSWARVLPVVGGYVSDAGHALRAGQAGIDAGDIVLTVVQPYADLLGFSGPGDNVLAAKTAEQTTQERIDFIVKTIPDLIPKIDSISAKAKIVSEEVSQINPDRYSRKVQGKDLRALIISAQGLAVQTADLLTNGKPVLEKAPYLLGMDSPRTYLMLFQNDKELRPTGGFMTAYAIMKVDKAKFEPVSSNDIYNLDAQYKPAIKAPEPLVKYIKGPYILSQNLRLRDMNWSPDFAVSMKMFTDSIREVGIGDIDGIIGVDTQLLTNLLDVIGPIGVPGFGNFSTATEPECNCPQVIHELESFADVEGPIIWDPVTGKIILRPPNSDNRKKIIGPLMNSVLANALGQPKDKLPDLFTAGFRSLIEKHVLFYLFDQNVQEAVADFGLGGVIREYDADYLHINDANLGGRKSNLYATHEVEQKIDVSRDGSVTKTITITYKNPQTQDGWLNSVLPTWVRVYVPKGSTLVVSEGLEAKAEPYEDLGKTVFAGFFQLRPEGVSKVTFQYKLPFKVDKMYKLLIQKQPGTDGFLYTINLGKHAEEFYLKTDRELKIGL